MACCAVVLQSCAASTSPATSWSPKTSVMSAEMALMTGSPWAGFQNRRRQKEADPGSHCISMACIVTVAVRRVRMSKCGYGQRACHRQVARGRVGAGRWRMIQGLAPLQGQLGRIGLLDTEGNGRGGQLRHGARRSEEHTSELQS